MELATDDTMGAYEKQPPLRGGDQFNVEAAEPVPVQSGSRHEARQMPDKITAQTIRTDFGKP